MPVIRSLLKYYLPVLIWMVVIFSASGDQKSFQHSSRIIGPIVRWLFPQMTEATVGRVVFAVRKAAHVTEYAILAMLLWRAFRQPRVADPRPWRWSQPGLALLVVALYAASDEWHQLMVPNRQGAFADVLLDICGGALGLLLIWAIGYWRQRWPRPSRSQPS
jgi:VanZ family protein